MFSHGLLASSPLSPRAGQGVADAGQRGPACFSSPAHLSTQFPLSLPPRTPLLSSLWLLFLEIQSMPSTGTLLQALGPCRLTLWSSRTLLRHPLHHGELPVVPLEWMGPHFSTCRNYSAALFMLCSDSVRGMASQLGVTFLPGDITSPWLGKGWAGSI